MVAPVDRDALASRENNSMMCFHMGRRGKCVGPIGPYELQTAMFTPPSRTGLLPVGPSGLKNVDATSRTGPKGRQKTIAERRT
jgi:hypothetical protein